MIFNTKSTLKINRLKTSFTEKSKLNQTSVITLPGQLLCQVSEMQFCIQLHTDIWIIVPYLQDNPYWLNQEHYLPLFYSNIIRSLILMTFLCIGFFKEGTKKVCCILKFFSTSYCLKFNLKFPGMVLLLKVKRMILKCLG